MLNLSRNESSSIVSSDDIESSARLVTDWLSCSSIVDFCTLFRDDRDREDSSCENWVNSIVWERVCLMKENNDSTNISKKYEKLLSAVNEDMKRLYEWVLNEMKYWRWWKKDQINCSSLAYVFYEERFNTRSWLLLKKFSLSLWTHAKHTNSYLRTLKNRIWVSFAFKKESWDL